ncbi:MAG: NAD-glutamate dehydrogenase domain-containing protein, partial [Solirubrobacteraceae bacterium]
MTVRAGEVERELIGLLGEAVADRLPDEAPAAYREFVRQYYHWVPARDLADRDERDLCGAVVAHWRTARERQPGEAKVRVYNPERERDGWDSPYTAIEIVSDDMPFIVDSVTMELSRQGHAIELIIHPVMRVKREATGRLAGVLEPRTMAVAALSESVIHAEVTRVSDPERLAELDSALRRVLEEVRAAVDDWSAMRGRATTVASRLRAQAPMVGGRQLSEDESFLLWLADGHFTFLGYREYELRDGPEAAELVAVPGSGLGILRGTPRRPATPLRGEALELARSPDPLVLTKANSRATVHRPAYMDYVGVKRFAPDGRVLGEDRFLGLYTTSAYKSSPLDIPLLRDKVARVMALAGFPADSHDAKGLADIVEALPRDLLFQIDADELFEIAIGLLGLGERQRVRLFAIADRLDRFVTCMVCLPRDRFNTVNRQRTGEILAAAYGGEQVDWQPQLTESQVVRVDYVIRCPRGIARGVDVPAVEAQIAEATRAWTDQLRAALVLAHGEQRGLELYVRYGEAFPPSYCADCGAEVAVGDIERIEELHEAGRPIVTVYRRASDGPGTVRCQIVSAARIALSDLVPTFEHLAARVGDERPHEVVPTDRPSVWIYDLGLSCDPAGLERAGDAFAEAFLAVWAGELEDDGLNGLVLAAGLGGREVTVLRAILRYLRQVGVAFSDSYMVNTLVSNPDIVLGLLELFRARFDPDAHDVERAEAAASIVEAAIDAVQSLDEDRILRSVLAVIRAMLRTNHFRLAAPGDAGPAHPAQLSFKLDPGRLEMLPLPRPRYEIFVYSPRVEGIHLRGGKVARGGIRWSDRRQDFRTEVLGLMKAQMVKNALIVPVGSKGGFVVKRPPAGGQPELVQEAIACYRAFLRGLLDVTDNYVGDAVVAPDRVVRYDEDDPYLVVAADKGTAAFSDIANEVAAEYGFWLGDGFASGGSHGYDHKQMGITARGAWESVKRHFR